VNVSELHRGVNFGSWISQSDLSREHIESLITEEDFAQVAEWGFDHVRLPMDYPIFQSDDPPYDLIDYGFEKVDQSVNWCEKYGLSIVLDLHQTPGFAFHQHGKNTLFTDPVMQQRMIDLWRAFAGRYRERWDGVYYELINEILTDDPAEWNALAKRLIEAIREIDETHTIVLGGRQYNSATALDELPIFKDENVLYTFHHYRPGIFTHQKAPWSAPMQVYKEDVPYPCERMPGADALRARLEEDDPALDEVFRGRVLREAARSLLEREGDRPVNKVTLEEYMLHAVTFRDKRGVPVYCGEFGAIRNADPESRARYYHDIVDLFDKYAIPYAAWNYKGRAFAVVDSETGEPVSQEILDILTGKE
jgi:aryl-phospho-beta-D-glucosidase BglC (GH1 family)